MSQCLSHKTCFIPQMRFFLFHALAITKDHQKQFRIISPLRAVVWGFDSTEFFLQGNRCPPKALRRLPFLFKFLFRLFSLIFLSSYRLFSFLNFYSLDHKTMSYKCGIFKGSSDCCSKLEGIAVEI